MKRSHSFQSFLQAGPSSSLPDTSSPSTDPTLLQDSILSPPFYGRPYRLPPSPSFTELLKPQWKYASGFTRVPSRESAVVSGATTPESSDDESTIAKASEFAQSQSGKNDVGAVGTNEFYGFALYLGSSIAFRMCPGDDSMVDCSVVYWMGVFTVECVAFYWSLLLS